METIQIKGAKRENFGKKGSKDVRREGRVPAVIYGGHEEPIHFSLEEKEMKPLLFTPNSYIVGAPTSTAGRSRLSCATYSSIR